MQRYDTNKCASGHVAYCDACCPTNLTYTTEQIQYFKTPQEHEAEFARQFKRPESHAYLNPREPITDDISRDYKKHLRKWLRRITFDVCCGRANSNSAIMCDIISVRVWVPAKSNAFVGIIRIDIRPCAQGLGMSKLIFYQFIKICVADKKDLVVHEPLQETRDILQSMFGSIEKTEIRRYVIERKINTDEFPYQEIFSDSRFEAFLPEKKEKFYNSIYMIRLDKMQQWMDPSCDISLEARCRVEEMVLSSRDVFAVIDPDYFPSAEDLNDQKKVDERFDNNKLKKKLRQERHNNIKKKRPLELDDTPSSTTTSSRGEGGGPQDPAFVLLDTLSSYKEKKKEF